MNELRITVRGVTHEFRSEEVVQIGRSQDNDIVIDDSTVSRHHARLAWGPTGWTFTEVAKGRTFLAGKPVGRFAVDGPIEISLSSTRGPVVRMDPVRPPQNANRHG